MTALRLFKMMTATLAAAVAISASAARVPMYVAYSPSLIDYFYTTDVTQRDTAIVYYGYMDYGVAFYVESTAHAGETLPFKRFWKGAPQYEHFYTTSTTEEATVLGYGWVYEGVEGHLYTALPNGQAPHGSVPIYRVSYFDTTTNDLVHFYTTNYAQRVALLNAGWGDDGIAGYGFLSPFLPDNYKASILTYHSTNVADCNGYQNSASPALQRDLETIRDSGYTVVPLRWLSEWALGLRSGTSMPTKPVALTFDDGSPYDWYSAAHGNCMSGVVSIRDRLAGFKALYPSVFAGSPNGTAFVVASPTARSISPPSGLAHLGSDVWWASAQADGVIEIQNHSTDHEGVAGPVAENTAPFGGITLSIGGLHDGNYGPPIVGQGFCRIGKNPNGHVTAYNQVVLARNYIQTKTGVYPDLFATPFGGASAEFRSWLDNNTGLHGNAFAYSSTGTWVQKGAVPRYDIPRFVHQCDWQNPGGAHNILRGYIPRENPAFGACHLICS